MSIRSLPVISDRIYLQDISPEVKEAEGDCTRENQAWVQVRQSTEGENQERQALLSKRKVTWVGNTRTEEYDDVMSPIHCWEVYCCLVDAGNIFADEKETVPLLKFEKGRNYQKLAFSRDEFRQVWYEMPGVLSSALRYAVWENNPDWDMRMILANALRSVGTPEGEAEGEKAE